MAQGESLSLKGEAFGRAADGRHSLTHTWAQKIRHSSVLALPCRSFAIFFAKVLVKFPKLCIIIKSEGHLPMAVSPLSSQKKMTVSGLG
jgi:hypothetical protein